MERFDVIIAGGGMTGLTLALALEAVCPKKLSIAVIEAKKPNDHLDQGFDARTIALSHGTVKRLKDWGLWALMANEVSPIKSIQVSDKGHISQTHIKAADWHIDALGHVAELSIVGQHYQKKLAQSQNITYLCPDKIDSFVQTPTQIKLYTESGIGLCAPLFVAADGGEAIYAKELGLTQEQEHFNQTAIIANIELSQENQGKAFERFTSEGPLALLPMTGQRMSLVWCVSTDKAPKLLAQTDSDFLADLQQAFGWRLGRFIAVSQRSCYPLVLKKLTQTTHHRFIAVGNCAQTLHPIAGQGFNLAMRDIDTLVNLLKEPNEDIGAAELINQYALLRQKDRESMMKLTSGLVHLFSNNSLPLMVGRNLGLLALDSCMFLQKPLVKRMLGLI